MSPGRVGLATQMGPPPGDAIRQSCPQPLHQQWPWGHQSLCIAGGETEAGEKHHLAAGAMEQEAEEPGARGASDKAEILGQRTAWLQPLQEGGAVRT